MTIRYQIEVGPEMPNCARSGRILIAVVLLGVILAATSQAAQAQMFWSVETPDGRTNWLLGTIHTEDPRVLDFPPALHDALDRAERVALELVPDPEMLSALNAAMVLPRGERLSELLPAELHERVVGALDQYGLTPSAVDRLRPWAAAMTLALPPPETGLFMDMAVAFRASRAGADLHGLESLDEQLAFLTGLGRAAHIEMLELAVEDAVRDRALFDALVAAYLARDAERVRALAERELAAMGPEIEASFRDRGIVERNQRMIERVMPLLEQGGTLLAVGALHLPGEQGLVELLRARGYTVEVIY